MRKKMCLKKEIALLMLSVMTATVLVGCASSGSSMDMKTAAYDANEYYEETPMAAEPADALSGAGAYDDGFSATNQMVAEEESRVASANTGSNQTTQQSATGQKLIKTVNMEVETEDFDQLMGNLENKISALGGYIEYQYTYNGSGYVATRQTRYANLTARIPANQLDSFVSDVSGISNVVSKNTSTENVTLAYVDTESKKKMFLAEQESLLGLLEQATTVEDIVYLTQRLTEVRYSIESMESQLRTYDNLVDYATVILNVQEVEVYTPTEIVEKTTGERIADGFMTNIKEIGRGFKEFGIGFVINIPNIVLFLFWCAVIFFSIRLIIFIIKCIVKKQAEKRRKKKEALIEKQAESENAAIEETKTAEKRE